MEENETKNYMGREERMTGVQGIRKINTNERKQEGALELQQSSNGHRFESRTERYYPEENPKRSVGRNWGRGRGRG